MRVLFLIQGEGNGHLTQAISLYQLLSAEGHQVVASLIGSADGKKRPALFLESVNCPVFTYKSVGLCYSPTGKLSVGDTLKHLLNGLPGIYKSLQTIHTAVSDYEPDLIVNFYEICGGLYNMVYRSKTPLHCIAHQYLFLHPQFRFPRKRRFHRHALWLLNKITAYRAAHIYALSFSDLYSSTSKITVAPPLLRREVTGLSPSTGDYLLVYLTQPLLRRQIEQWHRRNPTVRIHCFCNNPLQKTKLSVDDTLTFHPTHTATFLSMLKSCQALVTTAGFETVCEAMLLGKPVMMVPVPNHYEQECNALDASLAGIGVSHKTFNLDYLFQYLPTYQPQSHRAQKWMEQTRDRLLLPLIHSAPSHRLVASPPLPLTEH
jgi:uncharacterized protein (TIGR00661 family)